MNPIVGWASGARMEFARRLTDAAGVPVLEVAGEIELRTVDDFRAGLTEALRGLPQLVILDFAKVTFFDSTGLHELEVAFRAVQSNGGRIALVGLQPNVARLFRITGLDTRYPIFASLEHALAATEP